MSGTGLSDGTGDRPDVADDDHRRRLIAQVLVTLFIAALCLGRDPTTYLDADFWAEDGAEFLAGPLFEGPLSIIAPIANNFHVLPRFVAWVAWWLPSSLTPSIYACSSLAFFAYTAGTLVRRDFAWVHPKLEVRCVVAALVAWAPGTSEVLGNLCNGMYLATFYLFLVLLRQPARIGRFEAVFIFVLGFSTANAILVLATAAVLYVWRRQRADLVMAALLVIPVALNLLSVLGHVFDGPVGILYADPPPFYKMRTTELAPVAYLWLERGLMQLFGLPLLGIGGAVAVMEAVWPMYVLALPALALGIHLARRDPRVIIVLLGMSVFYSLAYVGRSYSEFLLLTGVPLWNLRYGFVMGPPMVMVWTVLVFDLWRWRRPLAPVVALVVCGQLFHWWTPPVHPAGSARWNDVAPLVDELRTDMRSGELETPQLTPLIPVRPPGWAKLQIVVHHP